MLPQGTVYDPAEDPPGGVDPIGTTAGAEQLAEILFPGFTARMWRARFLTFAALASTISDKVVQLLDGMESNRLPARLAFERLFVSALARHESQLKCEGSADEQCQIAVGRVPGIGLARSAWALGNRPLSSGSFLKGQAVNGPFGVVARLARNVGILDEDTDCPTPIGHELLDAWKADGFGEGMQILVPKVVEMLRDGGWPPTDWKGRSYLASALLPSNAKDTEKRKIYTLLTQEVTGIRERMLQLLQEPSVLKIRKEADAGLDRGILLQIAKHHLRDSAVDDQIRQAIQLIDAYEQVAILLESAFRVILWGLTRHAERATDLSRQQRARRKRLGQANLHYARRGNFFVIVATHGQHRFFSDEGATIRDIRKTPLQFGPHSISVKRGRFVKRQAGSKSAFPDHRHRVRVQIKRASANVGLTFKREPVAEVQKGWEAKSALPVEPYAPMRKQVLKLAAMINSQRQTAKLAPISIERLRFRRRIVKPFEARRNEDEALRGITSKVESPVGIPRSNPAAPKCL